jgi:hypothetical protein
MMHELKSLPHFFNPIFYDRTHFDIRKGDRPFKTGDTIRFREWDESWEDEPGWYTGREITLKIRAVEPSSKQQGHVILFLENQG